MACVTLTFDNGPTPEATPIILDILQRHNVLSTFFVIGRRLEEPGCFALAERAKSEGHRIGNHTYTHKTPLGLDDDPGTPEREIGRMQALIGELSEPDPLFRPFGGGGKLGSHILSRAARDYLLEHNYTCVTWNCVPGDWNEGDGWMQTALDEINALDWSLVVLHDIPNGCVDQLDAFLRAVIDAGHEFVQDFPSNCVPIERGQLVRPEALPEPTL